MCPETIKSSPGNYPATEWRLEALGEKANSSYYTGNSQQINCWTVKLTLVSQNQVWVCIQLQTKVKNRYNTTMYNTMTLSVSPSCDTSRRVKVWPQSQILGFIPFAANHGDSIDPAYLDGQDLILFLRITVTQLESPIHAIYATQAEKAKSPGFDLSKVLENARQKEQYTDVIIVTKEMEFKAHKVVIASQSPFFATRLEERWTEEGGSRIDMTDISTDIMDAILTYMYTGEVNNVDMIAFDILPKAEEYQLKGLKVTCEEALSKTLTAQTIIDILLLADTHNAQTLKQSCLVFIAKNVAEVKKLSIWSEEKLNSGTNKNLWMEVLEFIIKSI